MAQAGERDARRIQDVALELIATEPQARVQYFQLVDAEMQPVATVVEPTYAAAAIFFGTTRLIDNIRCL